MWLEDDISRDFFKPTWTTALQEDEVLTAIRYPIWTGKCGHAVEEFLRRHGDFAIAGVACGVEVDHDGRIARSAISLFGLGPTPTRADAAESALAGEWAGGSDLEGIAAEVIASADAIGDIHRSAAYKRRLGRHLTTLALRKALEEATGG